MDIILLPGSQADEATLFESGQDKLLSLYHWLYDQCTQPPDIYLVVPEQQAACDKLIALAKQLPRYGGTVFFVIPPSVLQSGLLAELEEKGFYHLVVTYNNRESEPAHAIEVVAQYKAAHPGTNLQVSCWKEHSPGTSNHRFYRQLQRAGIEPGLPLFGPVTKTDFIPAPVTLQKRQPLCALVQETIVINEQAEVLFCPAIREWIGDLATHTPEQLLLQKGKGLHKAGRMDSCAGCEYKGRFQWRQNKSEAIGNLIQAGRSSKGNTPWPAHNPWDIPHGDLSLLSPGEQARELENFEQRLYSWATRMNRVFESQYDKPLIAIETPAFKGAWLMPCIESVLYQTAHQWTYYLVWDGGDELSRRILEIVHGLNHPRLRVFFSENKGIARARHFLSTQSTEEYILPLDDDDMLGATAIEDFMEVAAARPWSSIIRARRRFIDEKGKLVEMEEWFPFTGRNYRHGMVTDLHNHCQPALMRRSAYLQTAGWEGFPDFFYAGEDCDIYLKLEEKGSIELVDKLLYFYRLNPQRTSHELKPEGAYEMWRRLADRTIERIGLPVKRLNQQPPFDYVRENANVLTQDMIDFVIPFYDADEKELSYEQGRPTSTSRPEYFELTGYNVFRQQLDESLRSCSRVELLFSAPEYAEGTVRLEIRGAVSNKLVATGEAVWKEQREVAKALSFPMTQLSQPEDEPCVLQLHFLPARNNYAIIKVLYYELDEPKLIARFFRHQEGYSKKVLERCLLSLRKAGISEEGIHIIDQKQSSAANRNAGFYRTTKPLVCFLDDDVEICSGTTFSDLLAVMGETGADIIGPRLITPAGKIFCADPFFNEGLRPVPKGIGEEDDGRYRYTSEVPWLPSTLFIVKREVLMAVNGFDEGYTGSQMEDVDFCLKARQRDFKCVYAGDIGVIHYNNQRNDRFAENFGRFQLRWKEHDHLFHSLKAAIV